MVAIKTFFQKKGLTKDDINGANVDICPKAYQWKK